MINGQAFGTIQKGAYSYDYNISPGTPYDIDELEKLYDNLNEFLESGTNYPGWKKGIYPNRETAVNGINDNTLFVLKINNVIAGSLILNHEPETTFANVTWNIESKYSDVIVIHTLTVNPRFLHIGIGKILMDFAKHYSVEQDMKAIRLDVFVKNTPAIALYEKCGYKHVSTVDLSTTSTETILLKLYELVL